MEGLEVTREGEDPPAPHVLTKVHGTSMAVWNVPTPIEVGARFSPRIGVRCDDGCILSGATVEVFDEARTRVATGTLGPLPWTGTDDLYWVEVEARAPTSEGYHGWYAQFPQGQGTGSKHDNSGQPFGFSTTKPPEHTIAVCVTDAATSEAIGSAYVRVGLFTSYTDESGTAKVCVPKGSYELVVWKRKREMYRTTLEVAKDQDLKVELKGCKVCNGA